MSNRKEKIWQVQRKAITERVTPLRKKLRMAEEIYEKSPRLFDLVKEELDYEKKARNRERSL